MSHKKAAKQEAAEDDFAFLEKVAAANKAKIAEEDHEKQIPDAVFANLPVQPSKEFPNRDFARRDWLEYNEHAGFRPNNEAQEERLAKLKEAVPDFREAGRIHQNVREWAMSSGVIRPGVLLYDMCSQIEEAVRRQIVYNPPERQLAFPCGCSINNCAAHYSPLPGDMTTLGKSDVMKIDFGVAVNGRIIDSAFSVCFDDKFKPLLDASREATNECIKMAGPDARMSEIGARAEEVMSSFTLELEGKTYNIKPVFNLSGHQMDQYVIHCGKMIPICKPRPGFRMNTDRMEIGELYALETFASTGKGIVFDDGATSHFMVNPSSPSVKAGAQSELMDFLKKNYKTMAFCQRFVERDGQKNYQNTLQMLVKNKCVNPYPPLVDEPGCFVSQHEHTFGIFENGKEIFSR